MPLVCVRLVQACSRKYSGQGKIDRLLFVANKCRDNPIEIEALKCVHDEIKQTTWNTELYSKIVEQLGGRGGPEFAEDRYVPFGEETRRRDLNFFFLIIYFSVLFYPESGLIPAMTNI